jgi:hypothetical protein
MEKRLKKMSSIINRHPLLYYIRYILISKNYKGKSVEKIGLFQDFNSIDAIPQLYFSINAKIPIDNSLDELDKALVIAKYLRQSIKGGTAIGLSSELTLEKMLDGKGGVCSDFSLIFNIFCFINGIKVKEWGSIDKFYNTQCGHSFNEIYSTKYQKWIAIDIHKSIVFEDVKNNKLFSVVDLFTDLRSGNPLVISHFSEYHSPKQERIQKIYSAHTIPFIISNNKNEVTDYYFNKFQNYFSPLFINAIIIILRMNHKFIFVLDNYRLKLLPESIQKLR